MKEPRWVTRLKNKWNIQTNREFVIIMLVFSLAGMFICYERRPIFHMVGITAKTPFYLKFLAWLAVVFPSYQLNLVVLGALFGQFNFFWEKEKKMGRFFLRLATGGRKGV